MRDKKTVEKLSPQQLKKIWADVSIADWMALLQREFPDNKWTVSGEDIKGKCIYHDESGGSFHISPEKGFAYCYGASCKHYVNDPIQFVSDIIREPRDEALKILKSMGANLPRAYARNLASFDDNDRVKHTLQQVMNLELRDALANPDAPEFAYIKTTGLIPWLLKRRIPLDTLHMWPVGVVPTRAHLYERLAKVEDGRYQESAYMYLRDHLAAPTDPAKHEGWIAFFYYTSPTTIGRIKLRRPDKKEDEQRAFVVVKDPYDDSMGYFGLNMFAELRPNFSDIPLYVCEGDFDVLSTVAHQLENGKNDIFIVGTGGAAGDDIAPLVDFGFKTIHAIPDNDAGGVGNLRSWMLSCDKIERVFRWDDLETRAHTIKDLDDAWRAYPFDDFYLRLRNDDSYYWHRDWATQQVRTELSDLPDEDTRGRMDVVIRYGRVLPENERPKFVASLCEEYSLDVAVVTQDLAADDTEPGFIEKIVRQIQKQYLMIATETPSSNTYALIWNREQRILERIQINNSYALSAVLAKQFGSVAEFVRQEIGFPDFLISKINMRGGRIPKGYLEQANNVRDYVAEAVQRCIRGLPDRTRLHDVGQGVHYLQHDVGEPWQLYIVNGKKMFRGTMAGEGITFDELAAPVDGNFLFKTCETPWSHHLNSVEDISDGARYNPVDMYRTLYEIINDGWRMQHQEYDAMFLAADTLYTSIAAIFQMMVFIAITGESHSGKSTLVQTLGGNENPDYRLCEAARVLDNYTVAGVRQYMGNDRLRLYLDEFEEGDKPDGKIMAVRQILDLVRSGSTGGASVRGTSHGNAVIANINFPLTVSGIFSMDETRDLNRFVHIVMRNTTGLANPVDRIKKRLSPERAANLRRGITLGLLTRIPELLSVYEEVKVEFEAGAGMAPNTLSRLTDNLLPAIAILKYVGEDYKTFALEYTTRKMEHLALMGGVKKDCEKMWDAILYTNVPVLRSNGSHGYNVLASISGMITDPELRSAMTDSDIGAYYIPVNNWLVVHWQRLHNGVLRYTEKYKNMPVRKLKSVADVDPRVIQPHRISALVMKQSIEPHLRGANSRMAEISVFDLSGTLSLCAPVGLTEDAIIDATVRRQVVEVSQTTLPVIPRGSTEV